MAGSAATASRLMSLESSAKTAPCSGRYSPGLSGFRRERARTARAAGPPPLPRLPPLTSALPETVCDVLGAERFLKPSSEGSAQALPLPLLPETLSPGAL